MQLKVLSDGVAPAVGAAGGRVISMDLFLLDEATPVTWNHPGGLAADITVWRGTMEATVLREFLTDTAWGELDFLLSWTCLRAATVLQRWPACSPGWSA